MKKIKFNQIREEVFSNKQEILNLFKSKDETFTVDEITELIYPNKNFRALCNRTLKQLRKEGLVKNKRKYWIIK